MKKIRGICLLLCAALLLCALRMPAYTAEADSSVVSGSHSVDAERTLGTTEKLTDTSKAVILYERNSGTMVYAWNPDETIYPSSMVKLMTALVAIEQGNLEDTVLVTSRALSYITIGSMALGLKSGEEISFESLLYALMVGSYNDAATVIAEYIAGSQEAFVDMMNAKAVELGCTGTNFSNVHGLHDDNTYTTARDICRILDAALNDAYFRTLFCTAEYQIPATNKSDARTVYTTNHMISTAQDKRYFDSRVTGGRTGATNQAGRCLAITAEGSGMELIGIVMGAQATYEEDGLSLKTFGSFEDMDILLDYAFEKFEFRQVIGAGQALKQYPVTNGANQVAAVPAQTISTVLPKDLDESELSWEYAAYGGLTAPVSAGDTVSTVKVWYGDICVAQTNLVAATDVDVYVAPTDPAVSDGREEDGGGAVLAIFVGIVLGVALLTLAILVVVRLVRRASFRAMRRRRRVGRRRSR